MHSPTIQEQQETICSLELTSSYHECEPERRKLAVKVVAIFSNDTMTIVEITV